MSFIYHHHGNSASDAGQHLRIELFVHQSLWVDEEDVHFVSGDGCLRRIPFVTITGVNGHSANTHPLCRCDLIPHQRQQG
ncbi:MAG TPA: hypothetical protein VK639_09985 [Terriglobales bacterium]|nr:hypothetical protein [Terriglobales bacterium]